MVLVEFLRVFQIFAKYGRFWQNLTAQDAYCKEREVMKCRIVKVKVKVNLKGACSRVEREHQRNLRVGKRIVL